MSEVRTVPPAQESSASYTYRVEDVEEAFAGGQAVVGVDPLHSSHREKHPNGRPKSEEDGGLVDQLGIVCRHLGEGDLGLFRETGSMLVLQVLRCSRTATSSALTCPKPMSRYWQSLLSLVPSGPACPLCPGAAAPRSLAPCSNTERTLQGQILQRGRELPSPLPLQNQGWRW